MGFVLYSDIDRFFSNYLFENKNKPFDNYDIVIVSRDIITDEKVVTDEGYNSYRSRYSNIDFLIELFPSPKVLEFYHGSSFSSFVEAYKDQLLQDNKMIDLCCLVDLVVNDDKNIVLLCSRNEWLMEFLEILKDFIIEQFGLTMYSIDDWIEDKTCLNNLGDEDNIKKLLMFHIKTLEMIDDETGIIMNHLMEDMVEKYREVLMNKEKDELFNIAVSKGCYINKRRPKDEIVDHILKKMLKGKK